MQRREQVRQGDVLLTPVDPKVIAGLLNDTDRSGSRGPSWSRDARNNSISQTDDDRGLILAHGEVTGHMHRVMVADPATVGVREAPFKPDFPGASPDTRVFHLGGRRFMEVRSSAELKHDEHGSIALPEGLYEVTQQREYDPEAVTRQMDVID